VATKLTENTRSSRLTKCFTASTYHEFLLLKPIDRNALGLCFVMHSVMKFNRQMHIYRVVQKNRTKLMTP